MGDEMDALLEKLEQDYSRYPHPLTAEEDA